jgi:hypothetical protein
MVGGLMLSFYESTLKEIGIILKTTSLIGIYLSYLLNPGDILLISTVYSRPG